MPKFKYEAMDAKGQTVKKELTARNTEEAVSKIRAEGLFPTRVKEVEEKASRSSAGGRSGAGARQKTGKKKKGGGITIGGASKKSVTIFTRQFSTLIDAGVPVVQGLNILNEQMKPGALKNITSTVSDDVESGSSLSEAFGAHPKTFDHLYTNMVRAGEAGGVLDVVLQRLADFREKAARLKRRVIGAMVYPAAVLTVAILIVTGIMLFIIPQFLEIFEEMDIALPLPTRILMAVTEAMVQWWFLLPLVPLGIFVLYKLIRVSSAGRYGIDWMKFRLPIFGALLRKNAIARFTRTFGTLIASGVPILEALSITRDTCGNATLIRALTRVHDSIREGESIAEPLGASNVCEDMVVSMIDVGEETGNLDSMLEKVADNYDEEVDNMVESLTSLLEPIMVVGLGLVAGSIVVALFMPLIEIMQSLG